MTLPIPTKESPTWVEVPYLETTDRVIGGIAGSSNASALALHERTEYLKEVIEGVSQGTGSALTDLYSDMNMHGNTVTGIRDAVDIDEPVTLGQLLTSNPTFIRSETGAVERTLEDKANELLTLADMDSLKNALAIGNRVKIPSTISSILISTTDSPDILPKLNLLDTEDSLVIALDSGTHTTTADNIVNIGNGSNITLVGATPISVTIDSVVSVTGALGEWDITYALADATNVAINDVLRLDTVYPGRTFQGKRVSAGNVSFENETRIPMLGELCLGIGGTGGMGTVTVNSGSSVTTIEPTGTTYDALGVQNDFLSVGDLVHVSGQTRKIVSIDPAPAKTFTVDSNWSRSVVSLQWWYYTKPNTGTIGTGGAPTTAVTGVASVFLTEAEVGDVLVVNGEMREITAVFGDTSITVSHDITIVNGSYFSIIKAGILHLNANIITAKSGNNVTVRNNSWFMKPPTLGINGKGTVIKTVLKHTGTGNGLNFNTAAVLRGLQDIAIVGNGNGVGIRLTGDTVEFDQNGDIKLDEEANPISYGYDNNSAICIVTGSCAVINWGKGAFLTSGCTLHAQNQMFCNNTGTGIDATDGANAYLRSAVVSHNSLYGLNLAGGYTRFSAGVVAGNKSMGVRMDTGSSLYADRPTAWGNKSHGVYLVNFCGVQWVDGLSVSNGGIGIAFTNAASGRVSRTLIACNTNHGLSLTAANVEAGQIWATGQKTGRSGVSVSSNSNFYAVNYAAFTGNASSGVLSTAMSKSVLSNTTQHSNGTGLYSALASRVYANDGYCVNNTTDFTEVSEGLIYRDGIYEYGGPRRISSSYREKFVIVDDGIATIDLGTVAKIGIIELHCDTTAAFQGAVRFRTVSTVATVLLYGTGIFATTGILDNVSNLGTDDNINISSHTDGSIYIKNRSGATRTITISIRGDV